MIKNFITAVEEKYVFNVSHYFWHIFIALSSLALIGGVLILFWGIIPPGKDSVEKEEYPPVVQVSANEVNEILQQDNQKQVVTKKIKEVEKQQITTSSSTDPNEQAYNLSIDSLKILIPPSIYSWKSSGYWYYPYGERSYRRNKNTRWANQYRKWIVKKLGIEKTLNNAYTKSKASNFGEKKKILDALINLIRQYSENKREPILRMLSTYNGKNSYETIENINAISASIANFDTTQTGFLKSLITFGSNNPKEGRTFILYTNKVLASFSAEYRFDVLKTMINSFYAYFNNKVNQQIEVTDLFLKDIRKYEPEKYTKALEIYYQLMVAKNKQRERNIKNIDNEYSLALAKANAKLELAKVEKAELRIKGVYLGVGAITAIAILALILVLLSIQRYVKKIEGSLQVDKS